MRYEIQIGQVIDLDTKAVKPMQTMTITKEQFDIIRCFANTKTGRNLEMTYILNECEFSVVPVFEMSEENKRKFEDARSCLCPDETVTTEQVMKYIAKLVKDYYGIYDKCHQSEEFTTDMINRIKPKEVSDGVFNKHDMEELSDYFKEVTCCK